MYYVYILLNPLKPGNYFYGELLLDYEPFYVGKGKNSRAEEHMKQTALDKDVNRMKANLIKSIINKGKNVIIVKIEKNLEENYAFELEIKLIKIIGRKDLKLGPLTNLTDGGEGSSGRIASIETKHKISDSVKKAGCWKGDKNPSKNPEHILLMKKLLTGRVVSSETGKKISLSKIGKVAPHTTMHSMNNTIGKLKNNNVYYKLYLLELLYVLINYSKDLTYLKNNTKLMTHGNIRNVLNKTHWITKLDLNELNLFIEKYIGIVNYPLFMK